MNRWLSVIILTMAIFVLAGSTVVSSAQNPAQSVAPPSLIFELLAMNRDIPTKARPVYHSPSELLPSKDGKSIFVAEQTSKQISEVSVGENRVIRKIRVPNEPTGMALSPDGTRLYVTCSSEIWPAGLVAEVSLGLGTVLRCMPAGHGARSPVMNAAGTVLYVCNSLIDDISVIDVSSGSEQRRITVVREPYSAALSLDGSVLVVANSLPEQKATDNPPISCKVSLVNTSDGSVKNIPLVDGSHSSFGLAISADGKYAFITHLVAKYNVFADRVEKGWLHTNNFSVIDIADQKVVNSVSLDRAAQGFGNPWGVACSEDGKFLCIAHSGSNQISVIDYPYIISKVLEKTDLANSFDVLLNTFTETRRREISVKVKGPRALAIVGEKIYTAGYFSDSLETFNLSLSSGSATGAIALGPHQPMTSERLGMYYFTDATQCVQNWQSCASCHPFTRPDALNWTLGDMRNSPRNAKNMLYAWWTPPTSWTGRRRNAFESIRSGIALELFRPPDEMIAIPMDTMFMRLKHLPSPYLEKGRLSESARRGRELFRKKTDCAYCHSGPLFTDNKEWPVGISVAGDPARVFVTPHLFETWRTAPYGHLGSFDKLEDVINVPNHSSARSSLSKAEFDDLLTYVLSL